MGHFRLLKKKVHKPPPPRIASKLLFARMLATDNGISVGDYEGWVSDLFGNLELETLRRVLSAERGTRSQHYNPMITAIAHVFAREIKPKRSAEEYELSIHCQTDISKTLDTQTKLKIASKLLLDENLGTVSIGLDNALASLPSETRSDGLPFAEVRLFNGKLLRSDVERTALGEVAWPFERTAVPDPFAEIGKSRRLECAIPSGGGKTQYSYQLIRKALALGWRVFHYQVIEGSRASHLPIAWPKNVDFERTLFLLDNVHLFTDRECAELIDTGPDNIRFIAFARSPTLSRIDPVRVKRLILASDDLRNFMLNSPVMKARMREDWRLPVQRIVSEIVSWEDWDTAQYILDTFPEDLTEVRRISENVAEFVTQTTRSQLVLDGLENSEILIRISAYQFLDLGKMGPGELDQVDGRFIELERKGWVKRGGQFLMHPRRAERILRALNCLASDNRGATIGRLVAQTLLDCVQPSEWLLERAAQIRLHVRHSYLSGVQDLLIHFYMTLTSATNTRLPLDDVRIDLGSEHRRRGDLSESEETLEQVSIRSRNARWRYERAYISFLRGSSEDLRDAAQTLKPDLKGGMTQERFINRGLYVNVLARQGALTRALSLADALFDERRRWTTPDAKRWILNIACHRHELAVALRAHNKLSIARLRKIYDDFLEQREIFANGDKRVKEQYAFNPTLHLLVNPSGESVRQIMQTYVLTQRSKLHGKFEQEATYLACIGLGAELEGSIDDARSSYQEIADLPAELDNRRAINWARNRLESMSTRADRMIATQFLNTLYPLIR